MESELLLIEIATLGLLGCLWWFIWSEKKQQSSAFGQLDESLGSVVMELLERTKHLPDLESLMPKISLVNENPLASFAAFIRALRGEPADIFSKENFTNGQPSDPIEQREKLTYGDSEAKSSSEESASVKPPSQ